MRSAASLVALAASVSAAVHQGFNYGSTNSDGSIRDQQRFQDEFNVAKKLVGASGFNSARLYTSIQGGSAQDPISAIPAAIAADTTLLLGIWASAGQGVIDNELAAIQTAIDKYGDEFTSRVVGLSVGSEDLYRISPTGIAAKSGAGAEPHELVAYIGQVRSALASTALKGVPIGHVDTWNDWVNGSNSAVIEAVDWLGVDAYPYFQTSMANGIDNGPKLFFDAYDATIGAAGGKDVWITETGWPVSGPTSGQAEASTKNAKYFWDNVACPSLGKINTYWYTLQDSYPTTPSPSFGVIGTTLSTTPLFDLSCPTGGSGSAPPTSGKGGSTIATPTSGLATGGGGLTPTQGAGNGGTGAIGGGSGNGNGSSTLTPVTSGGSGSAGPSGGAGGSGSASPTGGAGGGSGGAGSASPSGGAGGGVGGGSGSGSGGQTGANGTVVPPSPTGSPTTGAPNAAAVTAGAGSLAVGAAIMAVVAAF